jgi:hypothetical protein
MLKKEQARIMLKEGATYKETYSTLHMNSRYVAQVSKELMKECEKELKQRPKKQIERIHKVTW